MAKIYVVTETIFNYDSGYTYLKQAFHNKAQAASFAQECEDIVQEVLKIDGIVSNLEEEWHQNNPPPPMSELDDTSPENLKLEAEEDEWYNKYQDYIEEQAELYCEGKVSTMDFYKFRETEFVRYVIVETELN